MGNLGTFPRSGRLSMNENKKLLLASGQLLEFLSKQSLCFVNSRGYLTITASRCFVRWTTCYGNAFSVRSIRLRSSVFSDCHVQEALHMSRQGSRKLALLLRMQENKVEDLVRSSKK